MTSLGMKHIPHDTQRTLVSILDKNKISETVIMDIMGHTDFKTTKEAYIGRNKNNQLKTTRNKKSSLFLLFKKFFSRTSVILIIFKTL